MANKFCRLLSNGYKINVQNNQLLWSPCCFYSRKTPMADKEAFEQELRYTTSATGWLPECGICEQMEASQVSLASMRQRSFDQVSPDARDGDCHVLEVSFDIKCNAACLSCGSYCSSTWQKYEKKHEINWANPYDKDLNRSFFKQLIANTNLDHLEHLIIMGGEPLYSDQNVEFLQYLIDNHPNCKQIDIRYSTNGSIYPTDQVQQLWSHFKSVVLNFSIDGVGERFDYLRWPLKWFKVERNMKNLVSNTDILINVFATVNPLSILYFDEIDQWARDVVPTERFLHAHRPVKANRCFNPLDLAHAPEDLRNLVRERYGADHFISHQFDRLEYRNDTQEFFDYVNKHDAIRRLSWKQTFPDVVQFFSEYK